MKLINCMGAFLCMSVLLTGCGGAQKEVAELTDEEKEINAVSNWFANYITDEEEFPDLNDYRYYARTIGLEMDGLLSPDMWEIYYSEDLNINKEIDGSAVYLIRLNPNKLLEIWAENNETTPDEICAELGTDRNELYYNFGYTANSVSYTKKHKEGTLTYPEIESRIFGEDNGENRQVVFSTHFLNVSTKGKNAVTYESSNEDMQIKQRDLLKSTTDVSHLKLYSISDFTPQELTPAFTVGDVGISRLLLLAVPNGRAGVEEDKDKAASVMFNMSPYSYGCTEEDIVEIVTEEESDESTDTSAESDSSGITSESESENSMTAENNTDVPVEHLEAETENITEGSVE